MLTFGSLFAGIGGFDLGLEQAGMECKWQVEIDDFCRDVLARHWPDVDRSVMDVEQAGRDNLEPVDLICGGFPCQDLSVAGRREGLAGERSGLWFEYHRILREIRPDWTVVENVPGLLSSNGGRDFAVLLRGLAELGYGVCWRVLDAQFFGVPQRRRRVFIVGHLGDGRAAEVLFERESGAWDSPPSRGAGERVAGTLDRKSASSNRGSQASEDGFIVASQCHGSNVGPMGELRRGNGHVTGGVPFVAFDRTKGTASGNIAAPLRACGASSEGVNDGKADTQCIGFKWHASNTSRSMGEVAGGSPPITDKQPGVVGPFGARRLTPTECARLQGFEDDWNDGQSDTQRYRQFGNAVCVPVAEWIGRRIVEVCSSDAEIPHRQTE